MSDYTYCPYCDTKVRINHDDGYGFEEDETYEQECYKCEKVFTYTTMVAYMYSPQKAPCLNGEPHRWKQMIGVPEEYFENRERCEWCDEEREKPCKEDEPCG